MSTQINGFHPRKFPLISVAAAALAMSLGAGAAHADEYEITWTADGLGSGSALVDASVDSGNNYGGYLVSDIISGTQNGQAITGLLLPNTYGYNTNEIFPTGPTPANSQIGLVDNGGLGFAVGTVDYDLFYDYGVPVYRLCVSTAQAPSMTDPEGCTTGDETGAAAELSSLSIAAVPVPLPASAWLMLSCLGGLMLLGRRAVPRI